MGTIPENMLVHTVIVRRYTGDSATGAVFAAAETVPCLVEDSRRLVRSDSGQEVVSETTFYAMPGTAYIPPESEVDIPVIAGVSARTTTVIVFKNRDGGGLPTPDHVEVNLK